MARPATVGSVGVKKWRSDLETVYKMISYQCKKEKRKEKKKLYIKIMISTFLMS